MTPENSGSDFELGPDEAPSPEHQSPRLRQIVDLLQQGRDKAMIGVGFLMAGAGMESAGVLKDKEVLINFGLAALAPGALNLWNGSRERHEAMKQLRALAEQEGSSGSN